MTVPETAMDEDSYAILWKNDVWLTGQVFGMQTKPETGVVKKRA